jgi:hypothetical protein
VAAASRVAASPARKPDRRRTGRNRRVQFMMIS